jgi:NAD-dependent SIR2 family protein deacetylase
MWRKYDAMSLATPEAFEENPALVWQFYHYRREKCVPRIYIHSTAHLHYTYPQSARGEAQRSAHGAREVLDTRA